MNSQFTMPMQWNVNPDMVMGDFTPIPDGWYSGTIVEMEYKEKQNKAGEGYLQLTLELDEGEHKGKQLFDNLNLWDTGEKAQQFTQRKVNTLCLATGQHQISDLNQLMHQRMLIRVKLQEARTVVDENTGQEKKYEARNQVTNYKAISAAPAQQASNTVPTPPQPIAAPTQAPPVSAPPAQATAAPAQPATVTPANVPPQPQGQAAAGGSVPPWVKK